MMLIDSLRLNIPFGPDMGIFGLIVGAIAGVVSGGAIVSTLSEITGSSERVTESRS